MVLVNGAAHAAAEAENRRTTQRRCVLIVHGVGEQKKSDTLLRFGTPLVNWVMRWAELAGRDPVRVGRVQLSFAPFDVGAGDTPPYARLDLGDQEWHFAEAWWAGSNFHPDLLTMLTWSVVHLFDILAQMIRNTVERAVNLVRVTPTRPAWGWQLVDLVNCVGLAVSYAVACVVGYVLLFPLMLLAQIPIEPVQNFIVLRLIRPALTAGAGEFRMYLDDELQAANVRRRVADAATWLMRQANCDELIILAHSEGCVVSLGMLTDPTFYSVAWHVRKFVTLGAGLNKSWLVKPSLDRLFTPLRGDTLWIDFWASYDPVPAGPLDPSPRVVNGRKVRITDIYKPEGDALEQVGIGNPPIDKQVTNSMDVITDHDDYLANDEQVVLLLASEIDAQQHTDSRFWPAQGVLDDGVRKRRARVSALALWRDVAVVAWAVSAFGVWLPLVGSIKDVSAWAALARIAMAAGPAGALVNALIALRDVKPDMLLPLAGLAALLLGLPAFLGLAALLGVVAWAVYRLVKWLWWQRWDTRARAEFLQRCVESRRGARAQVV